MIRIPLVAAVCLAALLQAGCSPGTNNIPQDKYDNNTVSSETPKTLPDRQADIVIIGSGAAGMTAAIQAAEEGAVNIVILEQQDTSENNIIFSENGVNACGTALQQEDKLYDSIPLYVNDTLAYGNGRGNRELVLTMADNSHFAVSWLNQMDCGLTTLGAQGAGSIRRTHRPEGNSCGTTLYNVLHSRIDELSIPVLTNTSVTQLLTGSDGQINGLMVESPKGRYTLHAKTVILACGGFGSNAELLKEYAPDLAPFSDSLLHAGDGTGILLASELGAALTSMERIQIYPTANSSANLVYPESLRTDGGILINTDGKRFTNELSDMNSISGAILQQPGGICYLIFDQSIKNSCKDADTWIENGVLLSDNTLEGLAAQLEMDANTLKNTMDTYTSYQSTSWDREFIRKNMASPLSTAPYYAVECTPCAYYTMGGVKINTSCEVLKEDATAIPGLYAAGEAVGGIHGSRCLNGNALTEAIVFGRIAGTQATRYLAVNGGSTPASIFKAPEAPSENKNSCQLKHRIIWQELKIK